MKKMLQRGFTLIELLVVIAIIGILAAVVLASLNDARSSGSDAAIKQSLGNLRSQAEIFYNQGGSFTYTNVCDDADIDALETGISNSNGGTAPFCNSSATAWVASSPLVSATSSWCVDSTGFAGTVGTAPSGTDVECP